MPAHMLSHSSNQTPCNTLLMKTVKSNKKECLVPFVTYSYHPVHLSLHRMADPEITVGHQAISVHSINLTV